MEKFERMLHCIISKCGDRQNVGTKVLCKLCYFSDFDHYEKNFESITGHNYIKLSHGPIPAEYELSFFLLEKHGLVKHKAAFVGKYTQDRYTSLEEPDLTGFSDSEIGTINEAIRRYGCMNGKEIEDISHLDIPWIAAKEGEIIDYGTVMYRDANTAADPRYPDDDGGE